jgi:phenylacetic acid degradation protein
MRWKIEGTQVYQELSRRSLATMVATTALKAPEPGRQRLNVSDIKPLVETKRGA